LYEAINESRFARTHIAGQQQKSLVFHYAIFKGRKRLGMLFTEPEEPWIGGYLERL
jgi:hypothetical protein